MAAAAAASTAAAGAWAGPATAAAAPAASPPPAVAAALARADAVAFDVDSTVITVEGIDELAAHLGKKAEVAAMTAAAMGGSVKFEDALAARLTLLAPTAASLAGFLASHAFHLTPGVEAVMAELARRGVDVYLVSGGFTQMIYPVADRLRIPRDRVFANTILFNG